MSLCTGNKQTGSEELVAGGKGSLLSVSLSNHEEKSEEMTEGTE